MKLDLKLDSSGVNKYLIVSGSSFKISFINSINLFNKFF